jgi:hypothetical protein
MLDADLARIYGVQTRALNQAIKRNLDRFPGDFIFDLSREEILRMSQSVISLRKLRFSKRVCAFTEHGAAMAAMVLKSLLIHDAALRDIYQKLRPLLEPPPQPPKPQIGFHVKEDALPYRIRRRAERTK